ncbi:hypothetical protein FI667_g5208, partial [Globisporangium splendens]
MLLPLQTVISVQMRDARWFTRSVSGGWQHAHPAPASLLVNQAPKSSFNWSWDPHEELISTLVLRLALSSSTCLLKLSSQCCRSDAHGALGVPKIKFIDSAKDKTNYWAYGIAAETNPPVSAYSHLLSEADRQKGFEKNFVANGFKSLREYIEKYQKVVPYDGRPAGGTPECGFTDPNGPPQPIPDQIAWRGPTFQHSGPCEAWCDGERVMYASSCKVWETTGGKMTYDKAKCIGKKRLTFYWLATFNVPFQVYTDCAPLQGATAGNSTTVAPTPAKTPAPKPATKTPTEKTPTAVAAEATSKPSSCKRRAKK